MHLLSPIIANARCEPSLIRQSEPRHMQTLHSIRNFGETCARRRAGRRSRLTSQTTTRPFSRAPSREFCDRQPGLRRDHFGLRVRGQAWCAAPSNQFFFFCLSSLVRKSLCSVYAHIQSAHDVASPHLRAADILRSVCGRLLMRFLTLTQVGSRSAKFRHLPPCTILPIDAPLSLFS
jgi:hypothetical protein